jgi:hypothetical protein
MADEAEVEVEEQFAGQEEQAEEEIQEEQASSEDTVDGEGTPAEEQEAEASEEYLDVSMEQIGRAMRAGMTEEQIQAARSSDELDRTVALLESRMQSSDTSADDEPAKQTQQEKPPGVALPEWKPELDDDIEPSIAKALQGVPDYVGKHLEAALAPVLQERKQMGEKLMQMEQYIISQANAANCAKLDNFVSGLGEEGEGIYGKGDVDSLDPNSPGFKARYDLDQKVNMLRDSYSRTGQNPPSDKRLLKEAHMLMHPETVVKKGRKDVLLRIQRGKGAVVNKPTSRAGRGGSEANAEKKTLDEIDTILKQ